LNSFEKSILRILLKRNGRQIAVFALIEGFPNDSEKNVIKAMDHLKDLGYVHISPGFPKEEEYISLNPGKKTEILDLVYSTIEPKETSPSVSKIPYSSLKSKSQNPLSKSFRFKRKRLTSTNGVMIVMTMAIFLVAGPLAFQIPTANNKITSDSNLNSMDSYFNYHNVFGDKQRHHAVETLKAVDNYMDQVLALFL
jgi:hypothetical protein